MLSLAGTPPLMGFFAKYSVILAFIKTNPLIALIAIVASAVSCARYLTLVSTSLFSHGVWAKVVNLQLAFQAASIRILNGSPVGTPAIRLVSPVPISTGQSYIISVGSCAILLAMLKPMVLINLTAACTIL